MAEIFKGFAGQVEVRDDGLFIRRKGFWAFVYNGLKGDKFIPYTSISTVQFKRSGVVRGYIQFGVLGGIESRGGFVKASKDENTVMFSDNVKFQKLKELVESRISNAKATVAAVAPNNIDGLIKLADLHQRGMLTSDEFAVEKAKLLS